MHARSMFVVLCALAAGCSDGDASPSRACGEQGCSAECEQLRGDNCDVLDAACQRRIFDAVVCVRGTPGELPEVRTITPEEYRAELLAEDGDEDAGAEEQAEEEAWSTGLALVGLVDPEETPESASIDDLVDTVAGFYENETRSITLIDRGEPEEDDEAQSLLAHELVHALQDQQIGFRELSERTASTFDAYAARACLTEGEATLYEELAFALLKGLPVDPGYWDVDLAWRLKHAQGVIASARSPYSRMWHLSYPIGARFVSDAWLSGGNRAVQGIYWAVPQSTIYWMHGYHAVTERDGQLLAPLACLRAAAPAGYRRGRGSSLGPYAVYALLVHEGKRDGIAPIEGAWQDALRWRQDSFSVFMSDADGGVAVSWRIVLASADLAERIAESIASRFEPESRHVTARARVAELEIRAAQDRQLLLDWQGTDPDACPDE